MYLLLRFFTNLCSKDHHVKLLVFDNNCKYNHAIMHVHVFGCTAGPKMDYQGSRNG